MAIYLCGVLVGVVGIYLVLTATFGKSEYAKQLREISLNVLGLRAPLGVFLAGWGGLAMITSAPFDNWWHAAYGLDVVIITPPHTLLIGGIRIVELGILCLILAAMNRAADAEDPNFKVFRRLFLYLAGLVLCGQMLFITAYVRNVMLHLAIAYIALALAVPIVLAMASQASGFRWAATTVSAIYITIVIGYILVFPLFPAQPRLGPIYYPVTHLVPPNFPILLIAPAFGLDLAWQRMGSKKLWQIALLSGVIFVAVIFVVEWQFAKFLMSHASENRFFGTTYFSYLSRPDSLERIRRLAGPEPRLYLARRLLKACVYASFSTWLGLLFGRWMRGVRR